MSDPTPLLTVADFLFIRGAVASSLKENSSTQVHTRIAQAETLMNKGFIDMRAVLEHRRIEEETANEPTDE